MPSFFSIPIDAPRNEWYIISEQKIKRGGSDMIKAMYVDRDSRSCCYAVSIEEAVSIFRANGLSGAAKEVGTDKWIEY